MSAFIVSPEHLRVLVAAGLAGRGDAGELEWLWPRYPDRDGSTHERGAMMGGRNAVAIYRETVNDLTPENAGAVLEMLHAENVRSVGYRYDDDPAGLPGYCGDAPYAWARVPFAPDPLVVLKALACYEYQSCEAPGWHESEAFAFCEALRARMIHRLPGFDEAPGWSIDDVNEARGRR